jgi:NAD-reducing hydrogenase large subunit
VTIHLNDQGGVEQTFFHVDEFRGLEKFCEGRPYFEMPQITQRICGICPVSHHLAAAKACDGVARVEPPRPARLLRELMHMGQVVQSHGMHFFHLAAPDLVLGFDADPAIRNVFGIIKANPELALKAVNLRRYGQRIIERLGGKRVHPNQGPGRDFSGNGDHDGHREGCGGHRQELAERQQRACIDFRVLSFELHGAGG